MVISDLPDWCDPRWRETRERINAPRVCVEVDVTARECEHHGAYESTCYALGKARVAWTNCPKCDHEWQREADERDAEIRGGMSRKEIEQRDRIQRIGIPPRFVDCTVWNWQHGMDRQRSVWNWVVDYVKQFDLALEHGRCCVLIGACGTGKSHIAICVMLGAAGCGKTHLAIGIAKHVAEKGGTARYTTVMDMLGRIKATYSRDAAEKEQDVLNELATVDMLVIDEVGRQLDTNYTEAQFFSVLDKRYRNKKPTVLVSNLNKAKFVDYLGAAIVDRLRENGGQVLTFDWASQRSTRKPTAKEED